MRVDHFRLAWPRCGRIRRLSAASARFRRRRVSRSRLGPPVGVCVPAAALGRYHRTMVDDRTTRRCRTRAGADPQVQRPADNRLPPATQRPRSAVCPRSLRADRSSPAESRLGGTAGRRHGKPGRLSGRKRRFGRVRWSWSDELTNCQMKARGVANVRGAWVAFNQDELKNRSRRNWAVRHSETRPFPSAGPTSGLVKHVHCLECLALEHLERSPATG